MVDQPGEVSLYRVDATPREFLRLESMPALCNALSATEQEAREAPAGDIVLRLDPITGLITNSAFDESVFDYSAAYENSLHFSPSFQAYADELASRLIDTHGLKGRRIVEIGSGPGHFLAALCDQAEATGLGFDPSFDPARSHPVESDRIQIRAEAYPPADPEAAVDADFICGRHVLEHLQDPVGVLRRIRESIGERLDVGLYFEVPNTTWILENRAVWDVIYEHVNYFTEPALDHLLAQSGFERTDGGVSFGEQYLWVEASPAPMDRVVDPISSADLERLTKLVESFETDIRGAIERWSREVDTMVEAGPVALWGTGSKGVTFLNLVPAGREIASVVDINPRKHGLFVPGTGQRVVGPEDLIADPPTSVIVMNPLYRDEIAETLSGLGITADVVSL